MNMKNTCYPSNHNSTDIMRRRIMDNNDYANNKLQTKNNGSMNSNNPHDPLLPSLTANMAKTP